MGTVFGYAETIDRPDAAMAEYLSIQAAREATGLRLVGLRGVPSPWTEAARGIFRIKGLACRYAARGPDEPADALAQWAGDTGIPVVAYEREGLRTGWAEILLLAERLAPEPALIPPDAEGRAELFGLAHEICGEMGLGWCTRLMMIQRSLGHGEGSGFPPQVASRRAWPSRSVSSTWPRSKSSRVRRRCSSARRARRA
jgi:hypothetical protein